VPKLLSGFIAKTIGRVLGPQVKAATLIKVTNTTRTAGSVSGGLNPTEASYAARGWVEAYDAKRIDGTTVRQEDRRISLLGAKIASGQVPVQGDKITIEGATYRIVGVPGRDPDAAVYECQGRK
jgi:hypothetical protein